MPVREIPEKYKDSAAGQALKDAQEVFLKASQELLAANRTSRAGNYSDTNEVQDKASETFCLTASVKGIGSGLISGRELPPPHALMIAQLLPDPGYLLYLVEDGEETTDTYHDPLEQALDQARWEFNVEPDKWDVS